MLIIHTMSQAEGRSRDEQIEKCISVMAEGNMDGMDELYRLIRTDVYAFALSKLRHREDAEDVTQDTFVRVWQNAPMYRPMGKPLAWIFTIEHNLIRRARNLSSRTVGEVEDNAPDESGESVEDEVIRSELVRQLLAVLDEDEREIVVMHAMSGLRHREIAEILEKPLSTVLSRYNRAIKKLQDIVKFQ